MLAHQNNVVSSCMVASVTALIVFTLVTEALNLQTVLAWFGSVVLLV